MSDIRWHVNFQIYRQKGTEASHWEPFRMEVDPDEYVLDGVERIWAFHDRSLTFRHACHHSACGACGMRVNGKEKLTCITHIRDVTHDGGTIRVEPLRNFPVVSDLVVDMGHFYARMDEAEYSPLVPIAEAPIDKGIQPSHVHHDGDLVRLQDCIECGLCISACPVPLTNPDYLGPAVLAAIQSHGSVSSDLMELADNGAGVWRCHSAYECSEVCPSFVEPGWRIMDLRRQIVTDRIKHVFKTRKEK